MADFRIDTGFFTHAKTKRIKRALGLEGVFALQMLWAYAAQNEHGPDRVYSADDIEIAVDWPGEAGSLVSVLASVGFLDEVPGGFTIHEWAVHNGFAATAAKRSEAGRIAANARWTKQRQCERNASAMRDDANGNAPSPSPSPSPIPSPIPEEESLEPCAASRPSPAIFEFPVAGRSKVESIHQHELDEWQALFPNLDVAQAVRECLAWNLANPTRRKTAGGLRKHIVSWLSREQDKGRNQGNGPGTPKTIEQQLAELEEYRRTKSGGSGTPDFERRTAEPIPANAHVEFMKAAARNSKPMPDFVKQKFLAGQRGDRNETQHL